MLHSSATELKADETHSLSEKFPNESVGRFAGCETISFWHVLRFGFFFFFQGKEAVLVMCHSSE